MILKVVYSDINNKYDRVKTFTTIEDATCWVEDKADHSDYGNIQILVDYELVAVYKEKYDLLFDRLLSFQDNALSKSTGALSKSTGGQF